VPSDSLLETRQDLQWCDGRVQSWWQNPWSGAQRHAALQDLLWCVKEFRVWWQNSRLATEFMVSALQHQLSALNRSKMRQEKGHRDACYWAARMLTMNSVTHHAAWAEGIALGRTHAA
jgi:hypothetical protein